MVPEMYIYGQVTKTLNVNLIQRQPWSCNKIVTLIFTEWLRQHSILHYIHVHNRCPFHTECTIQVDIIWAHIHVHT